MLVVLDGATGTAQMPQLMTQTGLLTVTSHQAPATGDLIELLPATAASLAVAVTTMLRPVRVLASAKMLPTREIAPAPAYLWYESTRTGSLRDMSTAFSKMRA